MIACLLFIIPQCYNGNVQWYKIGNKEIETEHFIHNYLHKRF